MSFQSTGISRVLRTLISLGVFVFSSQLFAQQVTYTPYIQLGDNGPFGPTDQVVIAWQTNETTPHNAYRVEFGTTALYGAVAAVSGHVVDNYLAADNNLPAIPTAYGAHTDYSALLSGLAFDTQYFYRVSGPGLPPGGFSAAFRTRTKGSTFSFAVEGDEGYFPFAPAPTAHLVNYEARIAHLIYNAGNLSVAGAPSRSAPSFVVNTGDNIYNVGNEANYRDFFFPVMNSDTDSNETGAPIVRNLQYFVVDGNHDVGSTGVSANMLADDAAPRFGGALDGGDALAFFNNFYYPLNGPAGFDIQNTWNGDSSIPNGMYFRYQGKDYNSPAAVEAFRASTTVDSGAGAKRKIDHMSNYSFDYGNAHFLFLDANPHLFNGNLPGGSVATVPPPPAFSDYPATLRNWIINDLDSTKQLWKIVVYHQPAFSSGDATLLNNQMRAVARTLEDHGVNLVFNGHEHNYQRSLPIRATSRTAGTPSTTAGSAAVSIDQIFNGTTQTVPDGVMYVVEGTGGNRDFDGDFGPPRGSGTGIDQDDSATGTFVSAGRVVPQGPGSWLDTNLTNPEMAGNFPNAGTGPKITARFKAKLFGFGHVVVDNNAISLYQISEPLQPVSSATAANPAPYGTDYLGQPVNDPIPDTVLDPATGAVLSPPATGTSVLLDKWTVTKPDLASLISAQLSAPPGATTGGALVYSILVSNSSTFALNGTQVRLTLPPNTDFAGSLSETATLQGGDVIFSIGRLPAGSSKVVQVKTRVSATALVGTQISATAVMTSSTALPISSNAAKTTIVKVPALP